MASCGKRVYKSQSSLNSKQIKLGPPPTESVSSATSMDEYIPMILVRKWRLTKNGAKTVEIGIAADRSCEIMIAVSDNCKNRTVQFSYDVWKTWCANHAVLNDFFNTGITPLETSEFIIPLNLEGTIQIICTIMHKKPAVTFHKTGGSGDNRVSMMQSTHTALTDYSECIKIAFEGLNEDLSEVKEAYTRCVEDLAEALEDNSFNEREARDYLIAHTHYDAESLIEADLVRTAIGSIMKDSQ